MMILMSSRINSINAVLMMPPHCEVTLSIRTDIQKLQHPHAGQRSLMIGRRRHVLKGNDEDNQKFGVPASLPEGFL